MIAIFITKSVAWLNYGHVVIVPTEICFGTALPEPTVTVAVTGVAAVVPLPTVPLPRLIVITLPLLIALTLTWRAVALETGVPIVVVTVGGGVPGSVIKT